MKCPFVPEGDPGYEILIEDADGRQLPLETSNELETAKVRLVALAATFPGVRLILRNQETLAVIEQSATE